MVLFHKERKAYHQIRRILAFIKLVDQAQNGLYRDDLQKNRYQLNMEGCLMFMTFRCGLPLTDLDFRSSFVYIACIYFCKSCTQLHIYACLEYFILIV